MIKYLYCLLLFIVSACAAMPTPCTPAPTGDVVYIVETGWHAEIGIPVDELDENLQFLKNVYPGAHAIMFGYGKKTFFTAPVDTPSEYLLGPFPGPAVVHTAGLRVMPTEAYAPDSVMILALPPGGSRALSTYIWQELTKDDAGKPIEVATNPDGLFYAAQSEYNLMHTCNTWTAEALHAAGLPIVSDNVVFSDQVITRASDIADSQCQALP